MRADKEQTIHVRDLAAELERKAAALKAGQRFMLGLVGAPGAGKSTVSGALVAAVNQQAGRDIAAVVPMDGFHYSNEELEEKGLLPLKGIPDSFDSKNFVELLKELRRTTDAVVSCPLFDRSIEASIPGGISIAPEHRLLIVEGNYLLLDREPWNHIRGILDQVWYLDVDMETILPRLLARHLEGGRTEFGAEAKMNSTDIPNARLIEQSKPLADRVIDVCLKR